MTLEEFKNIESCIGHVRMKNIFKTVLLRSEIATCESIQPYFDSKDNFTFIYDIEIKCINIKRYYSYTNIPLDNLEFSCNSSLVIDFFATLQIEYRKFKIDNLEL